MAKSIGHGQSPKIKMAQINLWGNIKAMNYQSTFKGKWWQACGEDIASKKVNNQPQFEC